MPEASKNFQWVVGGAVGPAPEPSPEPTVVKAEAEPKPKAGKHSKKTTPPEEVE